MTDTWLFAVVFRDGTLLHQSNVDHVDHFATGTYDVYFTMPLPNAVVVVSNGDDQEAGVYLRAYGGVAADNVVRVQCTHRAGLSPGNLNPFDCTFQLLVLNRS